MKDKLNIIHKHLLYRYPMTVNLFIYVYVSTIIDYISNFIGILFIFIFIYLYL